MLYPAKVNSHKETVNYKKAQKQSAKRQSQYNDDGKSIIQKLKIRFGLSADTKIIISNGDNTPINLTSGKVAVLNSEGTELICSVQFFCLPSSGVIQVLKFPRLL